MRLYCSNCQKHTEHENIAVMYASRCTVCNCQTNTLMRLQAEQHTLKAPDGNAAVVVENTPGKVTFFVEEGEHRGYYHHDKHTGQNSIAQA
jgi:NADH:ubiquinone oxidoreductase subunit D